MRDSLTLVLISDTHQLHRELDVPDGDILIHCGDISMLGRTAETLRDFDQWLGQLSHAHKLVVPGNHEFVLQESRLSLQNAKLLVNRGIKVEGLQLWGSPTTPQAGGAFSLASSAKRQQHWDSVVATDVLITHGPPWGILDRSPGQQHQGDPELLAPVQRLKPLVHVFGHVHGAYGQSRVGETLFVNYSLLGAYGSLVQQPVVLRLPRLHRSNSSSRSSEEREGTEKRP